MWRNLVKDYLTFTKKERTAVIVLVFLIVGIFLFPMFIPDRSSDTDGIQWTKLDEQAGALKAGKYRYPDSLSHERRNVYSPARTWKQEEATVPASLFYFDPNTLSMEGWKKLGLPERVIRTIHNYISKGGMFRKPGDLAKIYGMPAGVAEKLMPFVRVESVTPEPRKYPATGAGGISLSSTVTYHRPYATAININAADTTAFIALPGIGSKLAARIVKFREKLGGFYTIDQVGETFGLPDSTFQLIKPFLHLSPNEPLTLININTADVNRLKQHPYMRWNIANAIVRYREEHGSFKTKDELTRINIVTDELLKKMAPYITVEDDK